MKKISEELIFLEEEKELIIDKKVNKRDKEKKRILKYYYSTRISLNNYETKNKKNGLKNSTKKNKNNKTIIFIHGFLANKYYPLFIELNNLFLKKGFDTVLIDLPGYGLNLEREVCTYYKAKNIIKKLLEELKIKNKKIIIGHSFGGFVAKELINLKNVEKAIIFGGVNNPKNFIKRYPEIIKELCKKKEYQLKDIFKEHFIITKKFIKELKEEPPLSNKEVLLTHGNNDNIVPLKESEDYLKINKNAKLIITNHDHFFSRKKNRIIDKKLEKEIIAFIKK